MSSVAGCEPCSNRQCLCDSRHNGIGCDVEQCFSQSDCSDNGVCSIDPFSGELYDGHIYSELD